MDGKLIPVCSKDQGNQEYIIREEPLESEREQGEAGDRGERDESQSGFMD